MIACLHTSTPSSTISTFSGNAEVQLALDEVQQLDFCPTTCSESLSLIQSDGNCLTGDSSTKKEQSCPTSTLTLHQANDLQSSRLSEKSEENSDSFRSQLSELKELSLQFSQLAAATGVTISQMESMLTKLSSCLR